MNSVESSIYGHGSAWFVAVLVGLALLRHFSRQRGRTTAGRALQRPAPSASVAPDPAAKIPAGWMADPFGHFEQRYWSGTAWTEHVTKDGVPGTDPPPGAPGPPVAPGPENQAIEPD
jgi:hypothetical protein